MSRLVIIIDDSETCAETLQIALESIVGIEVRAVRNPQSAIAVINGGGHEIAAIVTDLHLKQDDGLDLIRQLRQEPRLARTPVILISGDSDPQISQRALAGGADVFFAKPYSPAAVRRKLEELIC